MRNVIRRSLPLVIACAALLGGCAHARSASPADGSGNALFAGVGEVGVMASTDLPDAYVAGRGLRSPRIAAQVAERLRRDGIAVSDDAMGVAQGQPQLRLDVVSYPLGADDYAVWVEVGLAETVSLRRLPGRPMLVTTWVERGRARVRGDDTAALWREIDRLTGRFISEYRSVNRQLGAASEAGEGDASR